MRLLLLAILSITFAATARAQLCDGELNVTLLDRGDTVRFEIDEEHFVEELYAARRLASTDGRFHVEARIDKGHRFPDVLLRPKEDGRRFEVRSGCGGNLRVTIVRSTRESGTTDTMAIAAIDACDVHAMITLDFASGRYDVLVCDSLRYPADGESLEGYRHMEMPYIASYWSGMKEAGVSLTRDDPPVRATDARSTVVVRLVDRAGQPLDIPHADVRVRSIGDPRRNPAYPALTTPQHPDPFDTLSRTRRLPPWQRMSREEEPGVYLVHFIEELRLAPEDLELWVEARGFVRWGPMPIAIWQRVDTTGITTWEARITMEHGSSTELAPIDGRLQRYDLFTRLLLVAHDNLFGQTFDPRTLSTLPGVREVIDLNGPSVRRRPSRWMLWLDRDLLPTGDSLLESLERDPHLVARPVVRSDRHQNGISSWYEPQGILPRWFGLTATSDSLVRAVADRFGMQAHELDPRTNRWAILAPPGTGSDIARVARQFRITRGIDSVSIAIPFVSDGE